MNIKLICITILIVMALYMFQTRYVFLINNKADITIGDKWTGCVDYSYLDSRKIMPKLKTMENAPPTKRPGELTLAPVEGNPFDTAAEQYGKMIRSEC